MSAYIIANNFATDYTGNLPDYRARVTQTARSFGGRYLARGAPAQVLEGQWLQAQRNVMSVWPAADDAEAFWFSDVYQKELRPNRAGTAFNAIGLFAGEAPPPAPAPANVYMLVIAQLTGQPDRGYNAAVAQVLPAFGGRYLVRGAPARVLEGEWFGRVRMVLTAFPSLKAATDFWFSPAYQNDIKPLRAGQGIYDVALFAEEQPAP